MDGVEGRRTEEDCESSSHINKREDTVCEAAEKSRLRLQPPAEIAGFEDSRNLLKIHRPAPNGAFGWAAAGGGRKGEVGQQGRGLDWQALWMWWKGSGGERGFLARGAPTATSRREFASSSPFQLVPFSSSRVFAKKLCVWHGRRRGRRREKGGEVVGLDGRYDRAEKFRPKVNEASENDAERGGGGEGLMGSL